MRKTASLIMVLITGIIFAFGCNVFPSPKTCISKYLESLNKKDYVSAYKLLSSKDKAVRSLEEFGSKSGKFRAIDEFHDRKIKYNITRVEIDRDKAVLEITYTTPNYKAVNDILDSETVRDKNEMEKLRLLETEFKDKIPFETGTSKYNLVREKDGWKVFLNIAEADKKRNEEKERVRQILSMYKNKIKFSDIEVTRYSDPIGGTYISGYIQNISDKSICTLDMIVYGLDDKNQVIFEQGDNYILLYANGKDALKPNYKKKFLISLENNEPPKDWSRHVKFEITKLEIE